MLSEYLMQTALIRASQQDDRMWGLMYRGLIEGLGLSPKTFQLIYPFTYWNWSTANSGHTSAAQYSFISTVPQWSAVGAYSSSGNRLSDAYENFLNALVVSADPVQQQKITDQQVIVQDIANQRTQAFNDARAAYRTDPDVKDNNPSFNDWLADEFGLGYSYGKTLGAETRELAKATELLDQLIQQSNDPTYQKAMAKFINEKFWTLIDTSSASGSIAAPGYMEMPSYMKWVTAITGGGGGNPGSISFSNSESSYSWKETWAKAATQVSYGFFSIQVNGEWRQADWMAADSSLSVQLEFRSWDRIPIADLGWFDGQFVTARADGEYRQGWNRNNFFGPSGGMALRKTEMFVNYQPSFSISTSKGFSSEQLKQLKAAGGMRIGPFRIGGEGGRQSVIQNSSVSENSFSGESASNIPFIFGIGIQELGGKA